MTVDFDNATTSAGGGLFKATEEEEMFVAAMKSVLPTWMAQGNSRVVVEEVLDYAGSARRRRLGRGSLPLGDEGRAAKSRSLRGWVRPGAEGGGAADDINDARGLVLKTVRLEVRFVLDITTALTNANDVEAAVDADLLAAFSAASSSSSSSSYSIPFEEALVVAAEDFRCKQKPGPRPLWEILSATRGGEA